MITEQPVRHSPGATQQPAYGQQPDREPQRQRWRIVGITLLMLSLLFTIGSIADIVVLTHTPAPAPPPTSTDNHPPPAAVADSGSQP
ncbi:MAG: hypothetical protein H0W02_22480, partial [Ktedonobacteraceae bacterium]|nr:hypothetical protein [Ktedonobacteraceae bacterium]